MKKVLLLSVAIMTMSAFCSFAKKNKAKPIVTEDVKTTKGIVETIAEDLRKTASQIIEEHPDAQIINENMIICGKGGVLGNGRFYGYNWSLKNRTVSQVNYIVEYNDSLYLEEEKLAIQKYGQGTDLNGNGRAWNTYENGGAGLIMSNGKPTMIVFAASVDFLPL